MNKNKTFIIAEAGVNHNGSIYFAYKLIISAKEADINDVNVKHYSSVWMKYKIKLINK